jgi:hypothetical protein
MEGIIYGLSYYGWIEVTFGWIEEIKDNCKSEQPMSQPRHEAGTSCIQVRSGIIWANMLRMLVMSYLGNINLYSNHKMFFSDCLTFQEGALLFWNVMLHSPTHSV